MTALLNARTTVAAPTRRARRFGLFSVADIVDDADSHWMLGGLTAEGEFCSPPLNGAIGCEPTVPDKTASSWYEDLESDPWLTYMLERCRTVGRLGTASEALRTRFLAAEQSAVERGLQTRVLADTATTLGGAATVAQAIGKLEHDGAENYGGQLILYLPFLAASEVGTDLLVRVGDHLETIAGNLVAVGNFDPFIDDGTQITVYATGAISLFRSPVTEVGPVVNRVTNEYSALIERVYGAVVDCYTAKIVAPLCDCVAAAAPPGDPEPQTGTQKPELDEGSSMTAVTLGITCGTTNAETATALNIRGVTPNPLEDWGVGNCAAIDCGEDVDREVRWNGHAWVGC